MLTASIPNRLTLSLASIGKIIGTGRWSLSFERVCMQTGKILLRFNVRIYTWKLPYPDGNLDIEHTAPFTVSVILTVRYLKKITKQFCFQKHYFKFCEQRPMFWVWCETFWDEKSWSITNYKDQICAAVSSYSIKRYSVESNRYIFSIIISSVLTVINRVLHCELVIMSSYCHCYSDCFTI